MGERGGGGNHETSDEVAYLTLDYWTLHEAPPDSPKKWAVRVPTASGKGKTVLFGARGYEDFTTHGDVERRERYRTRHQHDRIDDPHAPGFWSMWALWGESANLDTSFATAVSKAKKLLARRRRNPEEALETDMVLVPRRNPVRAHVNFMRQNPRPLREDWLEMAREAGRNDAMNFGVGLAERRAYLVQVGWVTLPAADRLELLKAWDEGAAHGGSRQNPDWAKTLGKHLYTGTRYAAESARDLYRGVRDEHKSRRSSRSNPRLSPCVRQYLETALFSSSDEDGRPLDDQFDISDFSPEAIQQAERDCLDFLSMNDVGDLDEEMVGHNFWLTRNRHGAGFWDAGLGALGARLTKAAHVYGSCDVYLGDDDKLHLS